MIHGQISLLDNIANGMEKPRALLAFLEQAPCCEWKKEEKGSKHMPLEEFHLVCKTSLQEKWDYH